MFLLRILPIALFALLTLPVAVSEVVLVDGAKVPAEVLFQHPNAPLLIVRSPSRATVQSLPLVEVAAYSAGGRQVNVNPPRSITPEEQEKRARNGVWGDEVSPGQIGKYATETWEAKPLLVWASPGESGDGLDYRNWLDEKGEPLTSDPWQREKALDKRGREQPESGIFDGDILLPAAEASYSALHAGERDNLGAFQMRHLTVEANAEYKVRYAVVGNLWMKDGAKLGHATQTGELGSNDSNKHTFARFCNWHDVPHEPKWAYAPDISHWVWVDAGETGSIEFIGLTGGPGDRFSLRRGTMVVSTDSAVRCGNRAGFYTAPDTTLILLDGAMIASPDRIQGGSAGKTMGTYGIGGTLLFGTPEKPLTRDLEFTACLYDLEKLDANSNPSDRASGASWIFGPTSRAVVHSADPQSARVIFAPRSRDLPLRGAGPKEFHVRPGGGAHLAPKPEIWDHPEVPKGVIAVFRGETDFNGVVFDGFYEGGIVVDPAQAAKWQNVTFGPANLATPDRLIRPLPEN